MATEEQIKLIMSKMERTTPHELFKRVDDTQAGISAVLRMLHESEETVTAGMISTKLNISTARVAVLLKKMVAKGLLTKEQSAEDGRVTVVKLTEYGKDTVCKMRAGLVEEINKVIDTVGEERLLEFFQISEEIRSVASGPKVFF